MASKENLTWDMRSQPLLAPAPYSSDIWCQSLMTCSNLFTWGPTPTPPGLISCGMAPETRMVGKRAVRILLECLFVNIYHHNFSQIGALLLRLPVIWIVQNDSLYLCVDHGHLAAVEHDTRGRCGEGTAWRLRLFVTNVLRHATFRRNTTRIH